MLKQGSQTSHYWSAKPSFLIIHHKWKKLQLILRVEEWIRNTNSQLPSTSVPCACTSCKLRYTYEAVSSAHKIFQAQVPAGGVQAWPKPLTGAGLNQNSHQVAVDETAEAQNWQLIRWSKSFTGTIIAVKIRSWRAWTCNLELFRQFKSKLELFKQTST